MDDTTSEATNPCSTSEMASTSMYNPSSHTYQWHFQQQMNEGTAHTQANQYQFLQGEAFEASLQPRLGGRRRTLSEEERKERRRQSDWNYKQRKKNKENEMIIQNKFLQEEIGRLSTENRQLKEESVRLSIENRHFKDESVRLSIENRNLKEETGQLTLENKHLEERIRGLQGKGQLPAQVLQRQDSYVSQSISQVDQPRVHVQDHYGMEPNNEEAVYREHYWMDSNNEGAVDGFDGLGMDDLLCLLCAENGMIPNGRVAINEPAHEHEECSHSGLCPAEIAKTKFLMKLDEEVMSKVDSNDFTGLEGEPRKVGRYSFPLSLIPTVVRINNVYGDVSATSLISPSISGTIYFLFCATIREMENLQLEEVTEDKMLKWRDVIKDALRLNFNVRFAMEHLKKIACAYFGLQECPLLQGLDEKISNLEAEVNDWKKKRDNIYQESKMCIDAAKKFRGVPVSTGLFP
ncbi:uncharacterized protein LOC111275885 [Durio zibethinus]|uniref:Uncharacterized protein LOC111275885 n=1 Tax=Durio zibethinus TaxID=66656 RepID=A0A6P5WN49_DURZI|nr:uncharacterized protein LOC111275885 [Durio zibethinus]